MGAASPGACGLTGGGRGLTRGGLGWRGGWVGRRWLGSAERARPSPWRIVGVMKKVGEERKETNRYDRGVEPVVVVGNFLQLYQFEFGGAPLEELHQNGECGP